MRNERTLRVLVILRKVLVQAYMAVGRERPPLLSRSARRERDADTSAQTGRSSQKLKL